MTDKREQGGVPAREQQGGARQRNWWGWGYQDEAMDDAARERLKMLLSLQFDVDELHALAVPEFSRLSLPQRRLSPPRSLGLLGSDEERIGHTYGQAFRDLIRALAGDFSHAPDWVARPRSEQELLEVVDWCGSKGVALVPYGGGTSVVGGVEARCRDAFPAVVSLDTTALKGVLQLDAQSLSAEVAAGTFGPQLEAELGAHGLSLRHYPQSFEHSTVGGWLATRAGGHFATLHTRIDDAVQGLTAVTAKGLLQTRRLPSSGAGPCPNRLFLGSEGTLGIITRGWLRVRKRPTFRASASVEFGSFMQACEAARLLAQSGLYPSNCRVLDEREALVNGIGDGATCYLLLGFESADHPLDAWLERGIAIARSAGGKLSKQSRAALATADLAGAKAGDAAGRWRKMFFQGPYLRDALVRLGCVVETFETAITWDRFADFHNQLVSVAEASLQELCGSGSLGCRLTHVYPDGAALYYTVIAPAKKGGQLGQWDGIKAAVSEAIVQGGGTITHHHAVGRDHARFYARERPELFACMFRAAKEAIDPAGIFNPGVL